MNTRHFAALLSCTAALCLVTPTANAAPSTLAVHGVLRAAGGGPAADGKYAMTVSIHADAKVATAVWQETLLGVDVSSGAFALRLGLQKPLTSAVLAPLATPHVGIALDGGPELSRAPLDATAFAVHAGSAVTATQLNCTDCITAAHIKGGALGSSAISFTYAGSTSKGGPAAKALDLECTGCVSTKELAFDGDIDLKEHAFAAAKVTAKEVTAGTVVATNFIGDGSKLTGIQTVSGECKTAGEVVKGINADGSLVCVKAVDPKGLPKDALDEVSNGVLTTEFIDETKGAANIGIPDNKPDGVTDTIDLPSFGDAKRVTVKVHATNANAAKVKILLFDSLVTPPPAITNADLSKLNHYVLYDGGSPKGSEIKLSVSTPDKPLGGDLNKWIGHNPKGKWRLIVIDGSTDKQPTDGAIVSWSIEVHTLSATKAEVNGELIIKAGTDFNSAPTKGFRFEVASKAPVTCDADHTGYAYYASDVAVLYLCDGKTFQPIAQVAPGTTRETAGKSCKDLLDKGAKKDGLFWLNPTGTDPQKAAQAWCDMTTDGGGWTLVMRMKNDAGLIFKSPYWTNTETFNSDSNKSLDPGVNENAKFAAYNDVAGTHLRGCKGAKGPCITVDMSGSKTVQKVMNEGAKAKPISRSELTKMFGDESGQPNCNQSGINADVKYTGYRLGLAGNNENDCATSDASWGWGVWGRSDQNSGCGCGRAGWQVANACFQGSLWVR